MFIQDVAKPLVDDHMGGPFFPVNTTILGVTPLNNPDLATSGVKINLDALGQNALDLPAKS